MVQTYKRAAEITVQDDLSSKLAVIAKGFVGLDGSIVPFDGRAHPTPTDLAYQV